jgi:hypothetical protein
MARFVPTPVVIAGFLALSGCTSPQQMAMPKVYPPPGKDPATIQSDSNLCERLPAIKSVDFDPRASFGGCMYNLGYQVRLPDGFLLTPPQFASNTAPTQPAQPVPGQSPASSPETGANPNRVDGNLYHETLDAIIRKDAAGWIMNKYDAGSVTNIRATQRNGKAVALQGDYTFNGNQTGWVRVDFTKTTPCLEYWDTKGTCRPVDQSRMAILVAAAKAQRAARLAAPTHSIQNDDDLFGRWYGFGPIY